MEKQSELPKDLSFEFDSSKLPSVSIFKVLFTFMTKQDIFLFSLAVIGSIGVGIHGQLNEVLAGDVFYGMISSNDEQRIESIALGGRVSQCSKKHFLKQYVPRHSDTYECHYRFYQYCNET